MRGRAGKGGKRRQKWERVGARDEGRRGAGREGEREEKRSPGGEGGGGDRWREGCWDGRGGTHQRRNGWDDLARGSTPTAEGMERKGTLKGRVTWEGQGEKRCGWQR